MILRRAGEAQGAPSGAGRVQTGRNLNLARTRFPAQVAGHAALSASLARLLAGPQSSDLRQNKVLCRLPGNHRALGSGSGGPAQELRQGWCVSAWAAGLGLGSCVCSSPSRRGRGSRPGRGLGLPPWCHPWSWCRPAAPETAAWCRFWPGPTVSDLPATAFTWLTRTGWGWGG